MFFFLILLIFNENEIFYKNKITICDKCFGPYTNNCLSCNKSDEVLLNYTCINAS